VSFEDILKAAQFFESISDPITFLKSGFQMLGKYFCRQAIAVQEWKVF
jgi:hypothetical protein